MNRATLYAALRKRDSGVFGTSLSQGQVEGTEAILDACLRHGVTDNRHAANVLAQVYHETGARMIPVRETFARSDAQAIARLDNAWKAGKLPWVSTPYWREGWFGRGPIQITHRENYAKMGKRLGVDLVGNPSLALDPKIGADIAVVGMMEGLFRAGHSLPRYFNATIDDPFMARRIVNGPDGTESTVAGYHNAFLRAIRDAGGIGRVIPAPQLPADAHPAPSAPPSPETAEPAPARYLTPWAAFVAAIAAATAALAAWLNLGG